MEGEPLNTHKGHITMPMKVLIPQFELGKCVEVSSRVVPREEVLFRAPPAKPWPP